MIEPALRVVHIAVKPDRIIAQVEVVDERCAYTTSALIKSLLPDYPHLLEQTQWENRARRRARVELSYADDLVALQALRDAARDLNKAIALLDARGSLPASRGKTMQ